MSDSDLYPKLLDPSDLSSLQADHKLLANRFEDEFKSLREFLGGEFLSSAVRIRELHLVDMLSSLNSLVVAKNSIIVLRGLDPSLFSLLFSTLPLQEKWLVTYFPNCFKCLLSLAKTFAETHNQFVAASDLFSSATTKTTFFIESPTAKHFERILLVLAKLLTDFGGMVGEAEEKLLAVWLNAVIQGVGAEAAKSMSDENAAVRNFRRALLIVFVEQKISRDSELRKVVFSSIQRFSAFSSFADKEFAKKFALKLFEKAESLSKEGFHQLLAQLPSSYLMSDSFLSSLGSSITAEQGTLGKSAMGTFYFQTLTNFLVNKIVSLTNGQNDEMSLDAVTRLYTDLLIDSKLEKNARKCSQNLMTKWRFIAQHFALFCVENRLKTPIGKAAETFTKFEGIVTELVSEITNSTIVVDHRQGGEDDRILLCSNELIRINFVLEMIDALDKLMTFSTRGAILSIADISTGSRLFFQTNQTSCQGWMARISLPLMSVCFAAGRFSQIVRLADNFFADVEQRFLAGGKVLKMDSATLAMICWVVRALVELAASQSILGVRRWVLKIYALEMCWIEYAELLASSCFEIALAGFSKCFVEEKLHDCVAKAVMEMCMKAIGCLRNKDFSKPYFDSILSTSLLKTTKTGGEMLMEQINTNDFLENLKHYQMESTSALSSWSVLEAVPLNNERTSGKYSSSNLWSISANLNRIELSLLRVFASGQDRPNAHYRSKFDSKYDLLTFEKELSDIHQLILTGNGADESKILSVKAAILKQVCAVIKSEQKRSRIYSNNDNHSIQKSMNAANFLTNNYTEISKLWEAFTKSPNLEVGQMLSTWISRLYFSSNSASKSVILSHSPRHFVYNSEQQHLYAQSQQQNITAQLQLQPLLIAVHAEMARFAGKTRNLHLSHLHLLKYSEILSSINATAPQAFNENISPSVFARNNFQQQFVANQQQANLSGFTSLSSNYSSGDDAELANSKALSIVAESGVVLDATDSNFKMFELSLKSNICSLENFDSKESSMTTVATCLRVLKHLVSHSEWFKKSVGLSWIARVNPVLWKDVIPQLFAHLSHSDTFIRQTVLQILERIGELSPHAICFPAIVNSSAHILAKVGGNCCSDNAEPTNGIIPRANSFTLNDEKELSAAKEKFEEEMIIANLSMSRRNSFSQYQLRMQENCGRLVEFLRSHFPRLVEDVSEFCREMHKINVLREERWLFALTRLDNSLTKRVRESEAEFRRQFTYDHLTEEQKTAGIRQRHETIAISAYEKLQRLFKSTCERAEQTENDKQFCAVFKSLLEEAMTHFYENRSDVPTALEPFRKIIGIMSARAMKRSTLSLRIDDISPFLANLASSNVPIPGQEFATLGTNTSPAIVTVQNVHKTVVILPTKTRPKKITFTGSDGKDYTFLLKGHEDLRLDERVTQLLRTCNKLLLNAKNGEGTEDYFSSTYSVTPLGPLSGLIEWVDGATPLFQLYRKWKIRELEDQEHRRVQAELKSKANNVGDSPSTKRSLHRHAKSPSKAQTSPPPHQRQQRIPLEPTRPTEQFFAKLKAVFAEEKLPAELLRDRQRWPLSCLEKVFHELVKETPRDILAKELWMRAGNSSTWWHVTRRFSRSSAVMSAIGWTVLGLGDRHLDNVLVDLVTGRVVHVDYNVCFEKGRSLRVPETVPFRLTGNIVRALGPTQLEGTFRESAIHVITQLRANCDILVSMLDAFAFEPANADDTPLPVAENEEDETLVKCEEDFVGDAPVVQKSANNSDKMFFSISSSVTQAIRRKLNGREVIDSHHREDNSNKERETVSSLRLGSGETQQMSPSDQVDFLIEKATSASNLALLYEGWTAWV